MKIKCRCGEKIVDNTDYLPHKAYLIRDKDWFGFWDDIDNAIENSGHSTKEKEAACMKLRLGNYARKIWQCSSCGRIYIDDEAGELHVYEPESSKTSTTILNKL